MGLQEKRKKRKNHDDEKVEQLLEVPRYELAVDDDDEVEDDAGPKSKFVKSRAAWRKELEKWKGDEADRSDSDEENINLHAGGRWLPITLENLFGGTVRKPIEEYMTRRAHRRFDEEVLQMELIAAEYSDEPPDDGELEGSGDDYMET